MKPLPILITAVVLAVGASLVIQIALRAEPARGDAVSAGDGGSSAASATRGTQRVQVSSIGDSISPSSCTCVLPISLI